MEHKLHIIVGVLGGCVDNIRVTTDDVIAKAVYEEFCADYKFDPAQGATCETDVGTITVTIAVDDPAPPPVEPIEVFELEE